MAATREDSSVGRTNGGTQSCWFASVRVRVLPQNIIKMKQHSEKRAESAVGILLKTLERSVADTGKILDEYEATHTEYERDESRHYDALVAGHYALKGAIEEINNRLNK